MHWSIRIATASLVLLWGMTGHLSAGELTTAQCQQLVSASQGATLERAVQVTLAMGTRRVVFNVTRDSVGNVIARPIPDTGAGAIDIAQVSISVTVNDKGAVVPSAVTVVTTGQVIQSYNVQINADGTLANVTPVGKYAPASGTSGDGGGASVDGPSTGVGAAGGAGFGTATQFNDAGVTAPPPGAGTTSVSPDR